jgi:putative acetyltransferase
VTQEPLDERPSAEHIPAMLLRALEPADHVALHSLVTRPEVARTLGGTPADTLESARERLVGLARDRVTAIGAFDGSTLLGAAELDAHVPVRRRHAARLWVAVDPAHQRRGVGASLVSALCDAADRWLAITRIELGVHVDHAHAIRLYEKHGFQIEATSPAKMLRDGAPVAAYEMARIRPHFVAPLELGAPPPIPSGRSRAEIRVRPRATSDAAAFARYHPSESVMEGTFQLPFQAVAMWERRLAEPPPGSRVLVAEIDGEVVGSIGLFALGASPRLAHVLQIGMGVAPEAQGRGVGDALMRAAITLADDWLGVRRLELDVFVDNERARSLYERHGFVTEGRLRAYAFRRGTYVDTFMMGRLSPRAG